MQNAYNTQVKPEQADEHDQAFDSAEKAHIKATEAAEDILEILKAKMIMKVGKIERYEKIL